VKSELGEPIHKIATRGCLFWRELDTKIFSLPRDKRPQKISQMKEYIIEKLNKDWQKVQSSSLNNVY
jgi:fatty acid synthase subunit beta